MKFKNLLLFLILLVIVIFVIGCVFQQQTKAPETFAPSTGKIETINENGTRMTEQYTKEITEQITGEKTNETREFKGIKNDPIYQSQGMGNFCTSLSGCFIFCKNNVGICNNFCRKNPSHELCIVPDAAKPQEWVKDAVTQPLPEGASSIRLIWPAQLDDTFLDQIGAYGAHPAGHAEGLDHEWIWIKDSNPIRSWADGQIMYVNTIENHIQDDTPNIIIYYGDGLWGEHMHVQSSLVKPGDVVKAGDPIGYGEKYAHAPGYQFAEFNVADQHRRDGVGYWYKFVKGATLVSPFDYLREDVKEELVKKFTQEVIERYLAGGKEVSGVIPTPWEPYLTNPILFHRNYPKGLEGEWFLKSAPWGLDGTPDIVLFFPLQTKYYQKQRFVQVDEDPKRDQKNLLLSGDWEADYTNNRMVINTTQGVYYGIFELDDSAQQAKLKIEYKKGSYPNGFSQQANVYTEREPISKGEEIHYWEHPEDDPRNWENK